MERIQQYYENTKELPPNDLLQEAITLVSERNAALDLGTGAGRDAKLLIAEGFNVIDVVDSNPIAQTYASESVQFTASTFDRFTFEPGKYDLINAHYSLPFNSSDTFEAMFERLTASLKKGGVFTGQFFGPEDSWAKHPEGMTFHSREALEQLLVPFEVEKLEERTYHGKTGLGEEKFWHVFNVIARRL